MRELQPCGTYAAYQRHWRKGEPIDEACRQAASGYTTRYRAGNPVAAERYKRDQQIRSQALQQLAHEYPDRYLEIFDALKAIDQTTPKDHAQ